MPKFISDTTGKLNFIFKMSLLMIPLLSSVESYAIEKERQITLMTYNVRNGKGLDEITDYSRIGEIIKRFSPDAVALQELDSATTRSKGDYVLEKIAESAGMIPYYAPAINFQGGKYGIGILSKIKPISVQRIPLPGREEERMLIALEFEDYVFACTHLSLTEDDRNESVKIITDVAKSYNKPFYIGGDFNAEPDSDCFIRLKETFTPLSMIGAHTFPADNPEMTIDYIFLYRAEDHSKITNYNPVVVEEQKASDHRPIVLFVNK